MEIRRRLPGDYAVRATTNCRAQGCGWPPSTRYAAERCHPQRRGCHVAIWAQAHGLTARQPRPAPPSQHGWMAGRDAAAAAR